MLFEQLAEQEIRRHVRAVKKNGRARMHNEFDLAIDYLENRQIEDVRSELTHRFPSSNSGDAGQEMFPVTIPLTERYIAEAANAYNKEVHRYFVDDDGQETDTTREQTKKLQEALDLAGYDEAMHRNEQISVLLGTSCVWYQAKRGNVRPVVVYPHNVYPLCGDSPEYLDPSDPQDYAGFSVELFWATEDTGRAQERTFALITPAETIFYVGRDPDQIERVISTHENPFRWEQAYDTETGTSVQELPGQMLTFWHRKMPMGELVLDTDPDIVYANRELNVLWSVLFDHIRFQGHAVPVLNLGNPNSAKAKRKYGTRHPVTLDIGEAFNLVSAATSYTEQVDVLKQYTRLIAMSKRMSATDFSIDTAAPQSGFAKLVDSIPKLEAREERVRRLKHMEENVAAKRLMSILTHQGKLDAVALKMRLRVKFSDIEFPKTADEKAKELETKFKYNLSSPARVMAEHEGITIEEAQERIAENKAQNASGQPKQDPAAPVAGPRPTVGLFGGLVRQTKNPAKDDKGDA